MKLFIVRAEQQGAPESVIAGVYSTRELANIRCDVLEAEGWDIVWIDVVDMEKNGVDCMLWNR